ncbi:MAG: UbiD family decarboxylase [Deltaproteobacteria bacterium]|nr:UbiD family decarboxylase [Deltaproteobacteria bacterium]
MERDAVTTYRDLRDWLEQVEAMGELKQLKGAHWNQEIGAITECSRRQPHAPALLFDEIQDYRPGFRVLSNALNSLNRVALAARLPLGLTKLQYVDAWREKHISLRPTPPVEVPHGPVTENVLKGDAVDLLKFPTPIWHFKDGGRYIGTGSITITRDPDGGWVNFGVYRTMIVDRTHVTCYISPGKDGRIHRTKYFDKGKPCPMVISVGHDPLLFLAGFQAIPYGESEYDWAGGMRGKAIEVIRGEFTGLPIPADSEIAIEGEVLPDKSVPEGPFGEWTGYYGSSVRGENLFVVKAIYHRNNPIILGNPPGRPPHAQGTMASCFARAGQIKVELEKAGVPDVVGVWSHEVGGHRLMIVVSIRQRYPGHARQAGMIASFCRGSAYLGRYVIVVDDDIDVSDLNDVMWAVCTRSDPESSIEIIRRCWSGPLDPIIPKSRKGFNSRAIIDACRPYEWRDEFPDTVDVEENLKRQVMEKWKEIFPS